jgi:hypothetical protein
VQTDAGQHADGTIGDVEILDDQHQAAVRPR